MSFGPNFNKPRVTKKVKSLNMTQEFYSTSFCVRKFIEICLIALCKVSSSGHQMYDLKLIFLVKKRMRSHSRNDKFSSSYAVDIFGMAKK